MGIEGFSHDSALLYHRHLPTAIVGRARPSPDGPARTTRRPTTRCSRGTCSPTSSTPRAADAVTGRQLLMANPDVRLLVRRRRPAVAALPQRDRRRAASTSSRAAACSRRCSARWRSAPATTSCCRRRRRTAGCPTSRPGNRCGCWSSRPPGTSARRGATCRREGQFLEHSPYCERDLRGPDRAAASSRARTSRCWCGTGRASTRYTLREPSRSTSSAGTAASTRTPSASTTSSPSPVGCTSRRRCTRRSRARASSSARSCRGCSTTTRESIPAPYNHANVDSDEMIFYVGGDFMSRKGAGIEMGSITLHPSGFTHGPQPGSVEASIGAETHRGVRGDGRHLPAARPRRRGVRLRGRVVPVDVGRAAGARSPAPTTAPTPAELLAGQPAKGSGRRWRGGRTSAAPRSRADTPCGDASRRRRAAGRAAAPGPRRGSRRARDSGAVSPCRG